VGGGTRARRGRAEERRKGKRPRRMGKICGGDVRSEKRILKIKTTGAIGKDACCRTKKKWDLRKRGGAGAGTVGDVAAREEHRYIGGERDQEGSPTETFLEILR